MKLVDDIWPAWEILGRLAPSRVQCWAREMNVLKVYTQTFDPETRGLRGVRVMH